MLKEHKVMTYEECLFEVVYLRMLEPSLMLNVTGRELVGMLC